MKSKLFFFLLITPILFLWAQPQKYVLKIEGMTCPACAASVESQLKKIKGVEKVAIDLSKGKATVVAQTKMETALFTQAVEKAGFKAISVQKNP